MKEAPENDETCYAPIYFQDCKRKIDAVLVFDSNDLKTKHFRDTFFKNLLANHLQIEYDTPDDKISKTHSVSLVFLKVHGSKKVLHKNAAKYGITIKFKQTLQISQPTVPCGFMKTILNVPYPYRKHSVSKRAWETVSKAQPKTFTSSERSAIVFAMMESIQYGDNDYEIGVSQLVHNKILIAAYPLHDGDWTWSNSPTEPLNDRQLLVKYWASYKMWNTQQPLNVVEKYFGFEIALYFAWLGFYNKMLIIASCFGIITFIIGILIVYLVLPVPIQEACESSNIICPMCKYCKPKKLKDYCMNFRISYFNDNIMSVIFAIGMAFWAAFFTEFWKRQCAILLARWQVNPQLDTMCRPEFLIKATNYRNNSYSNEVEEYIPLNFRILHYSISVLAVTGMIIIVLITILCILLFESGLKQIGLRDLYIKIGSCLLTLIAMLIYRKIYNCMANWLTVKEVPRTQLEFDKSYMLKIIIFSMANSYGKLFYIAFFKGKFFTYPGDPEIRESTFPITQDICDPTGCVSEVFMFLLAIIILKPILLNCAEVLIPVIKFNLNKRKRNKMKQLNSVEAQVKQWEEDFDLNPVNRFSVLQEMEELVIQFGFITLLVPAFPLAPLVALILNIFEIRIDSSKYIKYHRRPPVKTISSLSVWFDAVQAIAYLAVVTNAFFISFTSTFIPAAVYYFKNNYNLKGFTYFYLSKFKITDDYWTNAGNITECWYIGYRYPAGHAEEYQNTTMFFLLLSCRFAAAVLFIIFVMFSTALISYIIPDMPYSLKRLLTNSDNTIKKPTGFFNKNRFNSIFRSISSSFSD